MKLVIDIPDEFTGRVKELSMMDPQHGNHPVVTRTEAIENALLHEFARMNAYEQVYGKKAVPLAFRPEFLQLEGSLLLNALTAEHHSRLLRGVSEYA